MGYGCLKGAQGTIQVKGKGQTGVENNCVLFGIVDCFSKVCTYEMPIKVSLTPIMTNPRPLESPSV